MLEGEDSKRGDVNDNKVMGGILVGKITSLDKSFDILIDQGSHPKWSHYVHPTKCWRIWTSIKEAYRKL